MLWWNLRQLEKGNSAARRKAAKALSRNPSDRAVSALKMALSCNDREVFETALETLIRIGWSPNRSDSIVSVLLDRSDEKRRQAVTVLEALKWKPVEPYLRARYAIARGLYAEAADEGDAGIEALVEALKQEGDRDLLKVLGRMSDLRVIKALISAVHYLEAREALVSIGALAVPELISAISDVNAGSRQRTRWLIAILGEIRDIRAVDSLLRLSKFKAGKWDHGGVEDIRAESITALSRFDDPRVPQALVDGLRDEDAPVRAHSVVALAAQSSAFIDPLADCALREPDAQVRRAAVRALGCSNSEDAVGPLVQLLCAGAELLCTSDSMGLEAAGALGVIGSPRGVGPLLTAIDRLCRERREYPPREYAATEYRNALYQILGKSGERAATEELRAIVTVSDIPYAHRRAGDDLLEEGSVDLSTLRSLAKEELIRRHAWK